MIKTDIKLSAHGYSAYFRRDLGGNCYRLYHEDTESELLRTLKDENELFSEVYLFGNPILFPPNRIRGGEFYFENRKYTFPINETATGCHIHGELYKMPFSAERLTDDSVSFVFSANEGEYLSFPHAFTLRRTYTLSSGGMRENVEITNNSDQTMPFMLAFHTTFNIPFARSGDGDACLLKQNVLYEQLRDQNYLPTLEYAFGRERDTKISDGSYKITESPISSLYKAGGNVCEISDGKAKVKLIYKADGLYGYRMLWRRENADFFVVEPQTCAIDAFHLDKSPSESGVIAVKPGESLSLSTYFALERM